MLTTGQQQESGGAVRAGGGDGAGQLGGQVTARSVPFGLNVGLFNNNNNNNNKIDRYKAKHRYKTK